MTESEPLNYTLALASQLAERVDPLLERTVYAVTVLPEGQPAQLARLLHEALQEKGVRSPQVLVEPIPASEAGRQALLQLNRERDVLNGVLHVLVVALEDLSQVDRASTWAPDLWRFANLELPPAPKEAETISEAMVTPPAASQPLRDAALPPALLALRRRFELGRGMVVVGPGVGLEISGGSPQATWAGVLESALEFIERQGLEDPKLIARVRSVWTSSRTAGEVSVVLLLNRHLRGTTLAEWARSSLSLGSIEDTRLALAIRELAQPTFSLVVDTLFDEASGMQSLAPGDDLRSWLGRGRPSVLHIHGHREAPQTIDLVWPRWPRPAAQRMLPKGWLQERSMLVLGADAEPESEFVTGFLSLREVERGAERIVMLYRQDRKRDLTELRQRIPALEIVPYRDSAHQLALLQATSPKGLQAPLPTRSWTPRGQARVRREPAEDPRLARLSNVGLLADAFTRQFATPFDLHEWVSTQEGLSHLAKSLPFHSTSGAATRLASLLVGRGYVDAELLDLVDSVGQTEAIAVLRERLGLPRRPA